VGGHSSVSQSINDPVGCFSNNLTGLVEFAKLFPGRLIYASSGSVYNNNPDQNCMETVTIGSPKNIYDYTKSSFDQYMSILGSNYIGLRFGTVVGGSPNMRSELLLNKMVKDALVNKVINLANPKAVRPVLYIEDLVKCLIILLNSHQTNEIFNLCSLNGDMEYYAESVSRKFMVPINHMQDSITYSFSMSNNKFSERFDFKFEKDINMILSNIQNNIIL
jgi:nucleoside-diphosphate-sugar epimerase